MRMHAWQAGRAGWLAGMTFFPISFPIRMHVLCEHTYSYIGSFTTCACMHAFELEQKTK